MKSVVGEISRKYGFSYMRVYNWKRTGVPRIVAMKHPEIKEMLKPFIPFHL